jgi:hypothetical protein
MIRVLIVGDIVQAIKSSSRAELQWSPKTASSLLRRLWALAELAPHGGTWAQSTRRVQEIHCTPGAPHRPSAATAARTLPIAWSRSACAEAKENRSRPSPRAPNAAPSIAATP